MTARAPRSGAAPVLALGISQTIAWASSTYLPAIVAAPIAASLVVPRSTVFGAFSVSLLVMAAAGPWVGRSIDLHGGRRMLCLSNVVLAAGLLMLAMSSGIAWLYAAWCLLGLGMAMGLYDAAFAALVKVHGRAARPAITGITLLGGFASTVGWALTAWMVAHHGWRAACAGWALLHLALALPLNRHALPAAAAALSPRAAAPEPGAPGRPRADAAEAEPFRPGSPEPTALADSPRPVAPSDSPAPKPADRRRIFVLLLAFSACTAFVTSAMAAHLPGLLLAAGTGAAAAVAAAALLGPAQVAARALEFAVARGWPIHPLVTARIATALHPLGALLLAALGGGPVSAGVFSALHGAGNGMITIAKGMLPLALFGAAGYGHVQGLLSVLPRIAQAAAPFLFGLVLDGLGVSAALALSGTLSAIALGALLLLKIPSPRRQDAR